MGKNRIEQKSKKMQAEKKPDPPNPKTKSANGDEKSGGKNVKSPAPDVSKSQADVTTQAKEKKQPSPLNNLKVKKSEVEAVDVFNRFNAKLSLVKTLNARSCLALDIDNDKISYIKAKKTGDKIQVQKCGMQTLDTGMDRFKTIHLALANLKSRIYKRGMKIYVSFDSPDINVRQIVVPKTKKKSDFESAIFFKNQNDLSNFNEKSIWNYQTLEEVSEEGTKKLRVLVTTIPYEVVRMYMEILINVGLRPERLVPRPLAVQTAYTTMVPESDNDMVVVISTFFTQIYYFRNGKLQFFRNAALGVSNIQKALDEKGNGSLSVNSESNKSSDEKKPIQLVDMSISIKERLLKKVEESKTEDNSVIRMLYSEIKRSIDYINLTYPTEKIKRTFVTGGGIQAREIMGYLQKQFDDSLVMLKPQFSSSEVNTSRYGEYFTALGTSLQVGNEFDAVPAQYKTSQVLRNANTLLITLLFLGLAGAGSYSYFQKYEYIKNQNDLAQLEQQYKVLNPIQTKYDDLVLEYNRVQRNKNEFLGFIKKTPKLLEALRLFSNETPPFIILNEMKFETYALPKVIQKNKSLATKPLYKYKITVAGQIKSDFQMGDVILINFMNQLNDLNYFKEIKLVDKRKQMDKSLFEFWLELLL